MDTSQGQDVIRCHLCSESVEFHCILCRFDLCEKCVLIHMKEKAKPHQFVEFGSKNQSLVLPTCTSHESTCETYCRDCKTPTCSKCITRLHKSHDIEDIETIIENQRKQITHDTEEERIILKKCQPFKDAINTLENEFDNTIKEISLREENMLESVRQAAEKRRSEVNRKKKETKARNEEIAAKISEAEEKLQQTIKQNEEILLSKQAMDFINYRSVRENFKEDALFPEIPIPTFIIQGVPDDRVLKLLGTISFKNFKQYRNVDSTRANKMLLTTFQSPLHKLSQIQCTGNDEMWMGGKSPHVYKMDKTGIILRILDMPYNSGDYTTLAINANENVFFSNSSSMYVFDDNQVKQYLYVKNWNFKGLCFARNGDLLASMRTAGLRQSKVLRFSGGTEVQKIQHDNQGRHFLSIDNNDVLFLTTNTDGDICVADWAGEAVVVFNALGELRFRYLGNVSEQTAIKRFKPYDLCADQNKDILVADTENNLIHIIDYDGKLIRQINQLGVGGLSIDSNKNVVVGDTEAGLVKIIKYYD